MATVHEGTPEPLVVKTALLTVERPVTTFALELNNNSLTVVLIGYVAVDQLGVLDAPDIKIRLAVGVPPKMLKVEALLYTIPPLEAVKLAPVPP